MRHLVTPTTREAEAGGWRVQDYPGQLSKALFPDENLKKGWGYGPEVEPLPSIPSTEKEERQENEEDHPWNTHIHTHTCHALHTELL